MPYLTEATEIKALIDKFTRSSILWLDTEVADYYTKKPRLSLIQVLDDPEDLTGDKTYIFDVLNQPELGAYFITQIMQNTDIEKVFHNASYDLRFLGKEQAKNVTCTLQMAKKIPYYILPLPNYQLKTLVTELCDINLDKSEQGSNWGRRPLTAKQLQYVKMDTVYVAQIHSRLQDLMTRCYPPIETEDLEALAVRYQQIEHQWKQITSQMEHIQERVKKAMQVQNIPETSFFKLSVSDRTTIKTNFTELAQVARNLGLKLEFPITLTQKIQKELGSAIEELNVEIETTPVARLTTKKTLDDEDDLHF
ncbi:3'-5' exonuclease [Crinalium epipsammum PCC 9333]|uniref:3'-5' exonuclease n=1 Tax=Crinalium epipsammum PCC 9333 TaxID=1173022 RepID=K9VUI9_9CYAN|nr:ribonuclease D [Crinalium epipsammum]AFZ11778.1 3'-5' exonuclease [Crinalium epipsammum PCC 9333]